MGSACCVAARDRTITTGSGSEIVRRNVRHSPSWSLQWERRGRVAGVEAPVNWFSDGVGTNNALETKYGTTLESAYASEDGSPLDSLQTPAWQRSLLSEGNTRNPRLPSSDTSVSRKFSNVVKELIELPAVSDSSPVKLSPSVNSVSSFSPAPSSSKSYLMPVSSTPLRWPHGSPGHQLLRQISDNRIPESKSLNLPISEGASSLVLPVWHDESNRGSSAGSVDSLSVPAIPEIMETSHRERWSVDCESLGSGCGGNISRSSSQISASPSIDVRNCGVCSKLLTEKSSWSTQKIISTNELAVVAVLICGHAYHAECLENLTPEINKYDPACPVCTFGEKQTLKLSGKAMKAGKDPKARNKRVNKRSRTRVVTGDMGSDWIVIDKQVRHEGKGIKMSSSSSMKISDSGTPSLRPYFSLGLKVSKSVTDDISTRKKGFFWSKSSKQ